MAFDFKKEYKDLYLPKTKPELIDVPPMSFIAVAGTGNPNEENGSYAGAMGLLYAFSYTIKMSKMGAWQPDGYFDYTVPPLEGLWWTSDEAFDGQRILDKDALSWISLIRQPDFVTPEVFAWAAEQVAAKKPELDLRRARLVRFAEGPCAQIMHKGPYDDEPATIAQMEEFVAASRMVDDIANPASSEAMLDALDAHGGVPAVRLHHEIYLGDPRRTKPENLKTGDPPSREARVRMSDAASAAAPCPVVRARSILQKVRAGGNVVVRHRLQHEPVPRLLPRLHLLRQQKRMLPHRRLRPGERQVRRIGHPAARTAQPPRARHRGRRRHVRHVQPVRAHSARDARCVGADRGIRLRRVGGHEERAYHARHRRAERHRSGGRGHREDHRHHGRRPAGAHHRTARALA